MTEFNKIYYSFSPLITDFEREQPVFQVARFFITPVNTSLSIMTLAENGNEIQVLVLGSSVIAINLGMYIVPPAIIGFSISKNIKKSKIR